MGQILKLHKMLTERQISCEELTNKYLAGIDSVNSELNAYISVTADEALLTAKMVDKKISKGQEISLLEGIPMTLKDNISTKGIETTCCSKMLKGYKPIFDATVWSILKEQNAVFLGKTNMDEFAMGSSCETSCFGGAVNPYSANHCAGGSTGGAAAAVAANIAAYGLGSDTGGSIRQPASFCGVVGFKPTYGTVSRYGVVSYASSFDQVGPVTSSVEDAAIIYDAISKFDEKDSTSQGAKGPDTFSSLNNDIKGMKIGIAHEYIDRVREDVKDAVLNAIKVYESMGAEIVYFDLPELEYAVPVYYILACAEASSNLARYDGIRYGYKTDSYNSIHEMMCKTRSEGFGNEVKKRILLGTYVLSSGYYDAYYKKAQNLRGAIVKAFDKAFKSCDVILTPTVPMTAFEKGKAERDPIQTYSTDIFTVPINIAGLPAVSVPCGKDLQGLPIGMQIIGNKFEETKILNAAYKYEQAASDKFTTSKWGVKL